MRNAGFLDALAKFRKSTVSLILFLRLSIRPHETIRLPLEEFSFSSVLEYYSKICRENSYFIKIWQEKRVFHMKNYVHSW
jgi:hypothetical protein